MHKGYYTTPAWHDKVIFNWIDSSLFLIISPSQLSETTAEYLQHPQVTIFTTLDRLVSMTPIPGFGDFKHKQLIGFIIIYPLYR